MSCRAISIFYLLAQDTVTFPHYQFPQLQKLQTTMVNDTALQLEGAPSWLHKRTSTFNSGVSEETESLTGEYSDAGELDSPDECTRQSPSQPQQALKTAACSQNDLLIIGGSASALSCIINLTNTVAGTGMLGLPGAFAGSGFVVGTILLIVASLFSANGLRLLALSAEKVGISQEKPSSFYIIANAALPDFTLVIDFAVALKCFGVATGYFITVGGKQQEHTTRTETGQGLVVR